MPKPQREANQKSRPWSRGRLEYWRLNCLKPSKRRQPDDVGRQRSRVWVDRQRQSALTFPSSSHMSFHSCRDDPVIAPDRAKWRQVAETCAITRRKSRRPTWAATICCGVKLPRSRAPRMREPRTKTACPAMIGDTRSGQIPRDRCRRHRERPGFPRPSRTAAIPAWMARP